MTTDQLTDLGFRKKILEGITSGENICRKRRSFGDYEVFNDKAFKYVKSKLTCQLGADTVAQMAIVSQLNVAKKMVNKRASIYNEPPVRTYESILESDKTTLENVYAEGGFNTQLSNANKYYCLRNQTFLQVVPRLSKLTLKLLQGHNIDVIPRADNPEIAAAYVLSSFDKMGLITSDGVDQVTADPDDGSKKYRMYQVWTDEVVFTMNGEGEIVEPFMLNELGMLPFVDISKDKDLQFFVELGQALTDFTVDYNVTWSDLMYTMRMQNFSVGVVSGDPNLKPVQMVIGPNKLLFLPQNPNNQFSKLDFDFKTPSPQLKDSLSIIESLITSFLSTQGLDTSTVQVTNGGESGFSSALERLMAMIDQYVATKDDFDLFKVVEKDVHKIVVNYLKLLTGTELLDSRYYVTTKIVDSVLNVKFHVPEMLETKKEVLENGGKEIDLGISDKVLLYAKVNGVTVEQAEKDIGEIDERKARMQKALNDKLAAAGVQTPVAGAEGENKDNPNSTDKPVDDKTKEGAGGTNQA